MAGQELHATVSLQNIISGDKRVAIYLSESSVVQMAGVSFFVGLSPDWLVGLEGENIHVLTALAIVWLLKAVTDHMLYLIEQLLAHEAFHLEEFVITEQFFTVISEIGWPNLIQVSFFTRDKDELLAIDYATHNFLTQLTDLIFNHCAVAQRLALVPSRQAAVYEVFLVVIVQIIYKKDEVSLENKCTNREVFTHI